MHIGVVLPLGEVREQGRALHWPELRELAQQAEAADFDALWLYDHLLYRYPDRPEAGTWEAWTMLTALAEATKQPALGTIVLCTAFRPPALLAKMADTLDAVSGGRLILGLGAGWHQPEFDAFGYPFDHKAGRFEEALQIIALLLREGHVDFHGQYYSAPDCTLLPRGPRTGGPPILVASSGPRMLRLTAQWADQWNAAWFGRPTNFIQRRALLETACAEVGRDPKTLATTAGVNVAFPDLSQVNAPSTNPDKLLTGSAEEIAACLRAYADLGVAHVICNPMPSNGAALARLADAVRQYRIAARV
jgi:alkanesulfonate monooxygenase SsuD/methylene tetrahydromethanopterin reductase-like flavin-dependent oxidoreductase (luciferase family)